MSATDELRRMLDERGVEWIASGTDTCWKSADGYPMRAWDTTNGTHMRIADLTPEQAIAATLGGGECETCHAESDLSEWVCSECQCWIPLGLTPENIGRASEWRYCPHCGRKVVK